MFVVSNEVEKQDFSGIDQHLLLNPLYEDNRTLRPPQYKYGIPEKFVLTNTEKSGILISQYQNGVFNIRILSELNLIRRH